MGVEPEVLEQAAGSEQRAASERGARSKERVASDVEVLRNYVGGVWAEAAAEDFLDDVDPATGGLLARVPLHLRARRFADVLERWPVGFTNGLE